MRKIAVINFKGGTGKTTTVVNVSAGLVRKKQRVLIVDVDAQGSLALSLGTEYSRSLADALTRQAPIQDCIVQARENLDIIPSNNSLMLAQKSVASYVNWQGVLGTLLQPLEEVYDFIILDCAASITLLNINALTYASEIFVPTQVEYLSLTGLSQVLENLARIRFPNRPRQEVSDLGISLIIPTMYDVRMRQSHHLLAKLKETYGRRVAHPIRINVRLSEAPSHQQTIFEYAPQSRGAFDYECLVNLILQDTLLVEEQPIGLESPFQPSRVVTTDLHSEGEAELLLGDKMKESKQQDGDMEEVIQPTEMPAEQEADGPPPTLPDWVTTPARPLCPYCEVPMDSFLVAGYRVLHCDRCGYQKQILLRDLQAR
jgi:chromosome partitioning protein